MHDSIRASSWLVISSMGRKHAQVGLHPHRIGHACAKGKLHVDGARSGTYSGLKNRIVEMGLPNLPVYMLKSESSFIRSSHTTEKADIVRKVAFAPTTLVSEASGMSSEMEMHNK